MRSILGLGDSDEIVLSPFHSAVEMWPDGVTSISLGSWVTIWAEHLTDVYVLEQQQQK